MPRDPLVYWDASVLIALLRDEERPNDEMDGVYEWARRFDDGVARMVVSSMIRVEVLESQMEPAAEERFKALLLRSNVLEVEFGARIADKAREIRDYYQRKRAQDGSPTLSTPDSMHLATAIIYKVDEFHTFDEHDSRKSLGLIPLSGNVAGHDLVIKKPPATQYELRLLDSPDEGNGG